MTLQRTRAKKKHAPKVPQFQANLTTHANLLNLPLTRHPAAWHAKVRATPLRSKTTTTSQQLSPTRDARARNRAPCSPPHHTAGSQIPKWGKSKPISPVDGDSDTFLSDNDPSASTQVPFHDNPLHTESAIPEASPRNGAAPGNLTEHGPEHSSLVSTIPS